MNKYQSYKPSGVEWVGEIPEHWCKTKITYYCKVKDGTHDTPNYVDEGGYPLVTQKDITNGKLDFSKTKNISEEDYFEINKRSNVEYNDIIMSMIGSIGNPTIVDSQIKFSIKNVCLFKSSESVEVVKYIHYFLDSQVVMNELQIKLRGGVQGFVSLDVLRNLIYLRPPKSEQLQIVQFLDEKTELIDKLISTKERKITLLKEQRISLINQVVTKGLNPNVKMKDSGVEWIGDTPEDWIKSKVKYVSTIFGRIGYRGYTVEDIVDEGEGVITISPSNIKNDIFTIEGENTFLSFEKYEESPEIQIFTDDIILVKTGSTIGKTSLIPSGVPKMTINPQLVVLKEIKINNKYFYYQTVCEFFKKSFLVEQTGSSTPTISQEKINGFPILIPSSEEQQQIVELLDLKIKEIDDLVQLEQKKIDLLKEYRQSLISEVVTGKINVTTD
jgi:type I restriction enzyme S subunit